MAEYVILIAIVIAAINAMVPYMRKAVQGAIKAAADDVGKQEDFPQDVADGDWVDSSSITITSSDQRVRVGAGGKQRTDVSYDDSINSASWRSFSEEDIKK